MLMMFLATRDDDMKRKKKNGRDKESFPKHCSRLVVAVGWGRLFP